MHVRDGYMKYVLVILKLMLMVKNYYVLSVVFKYMLCSVFLQYFLDDCDFKNSCRKFRQKIVV